MPDLDLPQAAEIAEQLIRGATPDVGPSWLKAVRVTVVLGHPGEPDSEHVYAWEMAD